MTWVAVMIGGAAFFGLTLGGADPEFAHAALSAMFAGLAMVVLAFPQSRAAAVGAMARYRFAVIALLALIVYSVNSFGALGSPSWSLDPNATAIQAWTLASLGLTALAAAGGADAAGRNRLLTVLLVTPIVLAFTILADQLDGVADFFGLVSDQRAGQGLTGPFGTREELGVVFALFILLGAFAALDELRRRPTPGAFGFPPLARRLMLPAASALISLNVLAVSGARGAMIATVTGVLVMWAIMTARFGQQGPNRRWPIPAYAAMAAIVATAALAMIPAAFTTMFAPDQDGRPFGFLSELVDKAATERPWLGYGFGSAPTVSANLVSPDAALSGYGAASTDLATWRIEGGAVGVLLGVAVLIALLTPLGFMKDRGRRPSRGLALAVGVICVCLICGLPLAVLSNPSVAHLATLLLGLSSAFVDEARQPSARSAPQGMPMSL